MFGFSVGRGVPTAPLVDAYQVIKHRALLCAERGLALDDPEVGTLFVTRAFPGTVGEFCKRYDVATKRLWLRWPRGMAASSSLVDRRRRGTLRRNAPTAAFRDASARRGYEIQVSETPHAAKSVVAVAEGRVVVIAVGSSAEEGIVAPAATALHPAA
jgi:hypothetical protein